MYDGQEAVAVGNQAGCNEKEDAFMGAYRIHGHAYVRGFSVHEIIAEMLGKFTGGSDGKGGSMHFYKKETEFYGGHGLVGDQISCVVGIGFAKKYLGHPGVAIGSFGDGACNQGQIHEGMNLAKMWNLPIIYQLENNGYAMGTSAKRHSYNTEYYKRYDSIPGIRVDGFNVLAIREAMKWAKEFAQKNGPILFEAVTYRYHGHSMSDPGTTYRTRDEIMETRKKLDCINQLKAIILENGLARENQLKGIDREVKRTVDDAVLLAQKDPEPPTEELFTDIYSDQTGMFIRNVNYEDSIFPSPESEGF